MHLYFLVVCSFVIGSTFVHSLLDDEIQNKSGLEDLLKNVIYDALVKYEETEVKIPLFRWAIDQLKVPEQLFRKTTTKLGNAGVCIGCSAAFKYFLARSRLGLSRDRLAQMLTFICTLFNIETERVCRGTVELNIDIFIYIAREKKDLTEETICSIILQNFGCFKNYRPTWSVYIPSGNSPKRNFKENTASSFSVLHLTDIHIDWLYEPGANAVCDEPLCCQSDQGNASTPENGAGKWGDYRSCDMPFYSLIDTLEQIRNKHPERGFSYIYFTGDIISHRVWETSKKSNMEQIKSIYKLFQDKFGTIPIFPILGNHEPHPLNVFSPHSITNQTLSTQWLFDLVAEEWSRWLSSEALDTIRYGGYYTVSVKPGFRIIALNSNVCYIYNWWLLYENKDPFYQLHWLSVVLAEAEQNKESVHILSHIPPGDNTCLQEWTRQYRRIVERFANTITGQFNGHTHYDELRVFYNESDPSQAINVAYNGGSFTPYDNLNPNYRIYEIDFKTFEVRDYEEWTYNIKEANLFPDKSPDWYKLYSFKDAYGIDSLKPGSVGNLVLKMASNSTFLKQYYRFKVREAEPSIQKGCERSCLAENLCSIVTTQVDDSTQCDALTR